MISYVIACSST